MNRVFKQDGKQTMLDINKLPRLQPNSAAPLPRKSAVWRKATDFFAGSRGIVALFLLLFLSIAMLNLYVERRLKAQVYAVFKEIGANGFGVSYQPKSSFADFTGGLYLDNVVLTAPAKMGGWTLKTGRMNVSANPLTGKIKLKFNGTHSLSTNRFSDARLIVGEGTAVIGASPLSVSVTVQNAQAASPQYWAGFGIKSAVLHFERNSESGAAFDITANDVSLPSGIAPPLPPTVGYLFVKGTVAELPAERSAPVLTDWIDNGGLLEIEQAEAIWLPFMAQLSGTVGLDASFSATAAGVGKVYGFFDLLDRLAKVGAVSPSQVSLAKIVLGERVKQATGETRPSLSASFSLQDGKVYAGQVPLN